VWHIDYLLKFSFREIENNIETAYMGLGGRT
jgi:Uri superfamily endonuclease